MLSTDSGHSNIVVGFILAITKDHKPAAEAAIEALKEALPEVEDALAKGSTAK